MLETYTVTISGPGLEMAKDVNQAVAFKVVGVLMGVAPAGQMDGQTERELEAEDPGADIDHDEELTIGEFLAKLKVSNNAERIAGIALYMNEVRGERLVAKESIPGLFQRAGEAPPKNVSRDLKAAVSKKLISEDHAKNGHYFVTTTGKNLLGGTGSATKTPRRRRSRSARKPVKDDPELGLSTDEGEESKRGRRSATAAGKGPYQRVLDLKNDGWLSEPRSLQDILAELGRRGAVYKRTDLTRQMMTLTQKGLLRREKRAADGSTREVWHYWANE